MNRKLLPFAVALCMAVAMFFAISETSSAISVTCPTMKVYSKYNSTITVEWGETNGTTVQIYNLTSGTMNNVSANAYKYTINHDITSGQTVKVMIRAFTVVTDSSGNRTTYYSSYSPTYIVTANGSDTGRVYQTISDAPNGIHISSATMYDSSSDSFVYDGRTKTKTFYFEGANGMLVNGRDYQVTGITSAVNAGRYYYTITGVGNYYGIRSDFFEIRKAQPVMRFSHSSGSVIEGDSFNNPLTHTSGISCTFKSSNTAVASVSANGVVTTKSPGSVRISATSGSARNYNSRTVSYTLYVKAMKTPTKVKKSSVKIRLKYGKATLSWKKASIAKRYEVRYRPSNGSRWSYARSNSTSIVLHGLAPDTKYKFQVRALNVNHSATRASAFTGNKTARTKNDYNIVFSYPAYKWHSNGTFSDGAGTPRVQYVKKGGSFYVPSSWYAIRRSDGKYYNRATKGWMTELQAYHYDSSYGISFCGETVTLKQSWLKGHPKAYFELVRTMK